MEDTNKGIVADGNGLKSVDERISELEKKFEERITILETATHKLKYDLDRFKEFFRCQHL